MKYVDTAGVARSYASTILDYYLAEIFPDKSLFQNEYWVNNPLIEDSNEFHLPEYETEIDLTYIPESQSGYFNSDEVPENLVPHENPTVAAFIDKRTLLPNLYHRHGNFVFFHNKGYHSVMEIDVSKFVMPSSLRIDPYFVWRPRIIVFHDGDHQQNVTRYVRARYQEILEAEIVRIDNLLKVAEAPELIRRKMGLYMMIKRAKIMKLDPAKFDRFIKYTGED